MRNSLTGKIALSLVSALALAVILNGCKQDTPPPSPTPQAAGTFTGQELPDKVEELEGTPLYSGSEELHTAHPLDGATYILIAPQDPLKALLVLEEGAVPADLAKRESKIVKLSGTKESVDSEVLVELVKERYQMDLQTDPAGRVVVLRVAPVTVGESPAESDRQGE